MVSFIRYRPFDLDRNPAPPQRTLNQTHYWYSASLSSSLCYLTPTQSPWDFQGWSWSMKFHRCDYRGSHCSSRTLSTLDTVVWQPRQHSQKPSTRRSFLGSGGLQTSCPCRGGLCWSACAETNFKQILEDSRQRVSLAERNRSVLNAVEDAILGVDLDGNISFANPSASKLLKIPATDILVLNVKELLPADMPSTFSVRTRDLASAGPPNLLTWSMRRAELFPAEISFTSIRYKKGKRRSSGNSGYQ